MHLTRDVVLLDFVLSIVILTEITFSVLNTQYYYPYDFNIIYDGQVCEFDDVEEDCFSAICDDLSTSSDNITVIMQGPCSIRKYFEPLEDTLQLTLIMCVLFLAGFSLMICFLGLISTIDIGGNAASRAASKFVKMTRSERQAYFDTLVNFLDYLHQQRDVPAFNAAHEEVVVMVEELGPDGQPRRVGDDEQNQVPAMVRAKMSNGLTNLIRNRNDMRIHLNEAVDRFENLQRTSITHFHWLRILVLSLTVVLYVLLLLLFWLFKSYEVWVIETKGLRAAECVELVILTLAICVELAWSVVTLYKISR